MVPKRYFLHAAGFDPYDSVAQYRRFVRELARFSATWNVKAHVSAMQRNGAPDSHWTVTAQAPDWKVVTSYELLDWSDIVRDELKRSSGRRLCEGLATFVDLIRSGTAWRYFTANWRYGMCSPARARQRRPVAERSTPRKASAVIWLLESRSLG